MTNISLSDFKSTIGNSYGNRIDIERGNLAMGVPNADEVIALAKDPQKPCRNILNNQPCPRGDRCHFRHNITEREKELILYEEVNNKQNRIDRIQRDIHRLNQGTGPTYIKVGTVNPRPKYINTPMGAVQQVSRVNARNYVNRQLQQAQDELENITERYNGAVAANAAAAVGGGGAMRRLNPNARAFNPGQGGRGGRRKRTRQRRRKKKTRRRKKRHRRSKRRKSRRRRTRCTRRRRGGAAVQPKCLVAPQQGEEYRCLRCDVAHGGNITDGRGLCQRHGGWIGTCVDAGVGGDTETINARNTKLSRVAPPGSGCAPLPPNPPAANIFIGGRRRTRRL